MAQWCLHQDTFDCFNISSSWTTFLFCTFVLMCLLFIVRCRTFELHIIQSSRNVFVSIALSRTILIFVCNEIAFGFWFIFYCFWLSNIWQLLHTSIYFSGNWYDYLLLQLFFYVWTRHHWIWLKLNRNWLMESLRILQV